MSMSRHKLSRFAFISLTRAFPLFISFFFSFFFNFCFLSLFCYLFLPAPKNNWTGGAFFIMLSSLGQIEKASRNRTAGTHGSPSLLLHQCRSSMGWEINTGNTIQETSFQRGGVNCLLPGGGKPGRKEDGSLGFLSFGSGLRLFMGAD